jgi:WD40 repeat protein
VKVLDENLFASGDDSGVVKIWDIRSRQKVFKYHDHDDFVSDMDFAGNTLVTSA